MAQVLFDDYLTRCAAIVADLPAPNAAGLAKDPSVDLARLVDGRAYCLCRDAIALRPYRSTILDLCAKIKLPQGHDRVGKDFFDKLTSQKPVSLVKLRSFDSTLVTLETNRARKFDDAREKLARLLGGAGFGLSPNSVVMSWCWIDFVVIDDVLRSAKAAVEDLSQAMMAGRIDIRAPERALVLNQVREGYSEDRTGGTGDFRVTALFVEALYRALNTMCRAAGVACPPMVDIYSVAATIGKRNGQNSRGLPVSHGNFI